MMEFEDEHDSEEEEEEDDEMTLTPPYKSAATGNSGGGNEKKAAVTAARYRECLKNHAVGIGGHAVDGCGEFMPAGPDGTLDALKCAACNCHRNFHRKEPLSSSSTTSSHHHHQQLSLFTSPPRPAPPPQVYQFYPYNRTTPTPLHVSTPRPLALPSPTSGGREGHVAEQEEATPVGMMMMMSGGGGSSGMMTTSSGGGSGKKRFRTKFTQEQKEKMTSLAERLGWRIQKQDDAVVQQFCEETGVKRHVLKVWMHNNKHTLGKKP